MFFRLARRSSSLQRLPLVRMLTKQSIVLAVLILMGTGALGGTLVGAFAQSSCGSSDSAYRVVFRDTLSAIAARYHSTVVQLASHNHIANPNLIFPAELVCIPSGAQTQAYTTTMATTSFTGTLPTQQQYIVLARQDALSLNLSPDIFVRQISQESSFNPQAVSPSGAIGIAQFEPGTASALGINPWDPAQSLQGAARLMSGYVQQFGGDYAKALAAYNAGPGTVQFAVQLGGVYWRMYLPTETQSYLQVILGY